MRGVRQSARGRSSLIHLSLTVWTVCVFDRLSASFSPQSWRTVKTGESGYPASVSSYSTRGGTFHQVDIIQWVSELLRQDKRAFHRSCTGFFPLLLNWILCSLKRAGVTIQDLLVTPLYLVSSISSSLTLSLYFRGCDETVHPDHRVWTNRGVAFLVTRNSLNNHNSKPRILFQNSALLYSSRQSFSDSSAKLYLWEFMDRKIS